MAEITVLLADDHPAFREGLRLLLDRAGGIRVVGEASDASETLRLAEALRPDVLLLDIVMPGATGLEILPGLQQRSPRSKILILSAYYGDNYVAEALLQGARGYMLKTVVPGEVVKAVRVVHAGEVWAERRQVANVLEELLRKARDAGAPVPKQEDLTEREYEVVRCIVLGQTNRDIAQYLGISEETVKTHVRNVFRKLQIVHRRQLILRQRLGPRP